MKGSPIQRIYLIKDGWVKREFSQSSVDIRGAGNCLGLDWKDEGSKWDYSATVSARTEVLEFSIARLLNEPALLNKLVETFDEFSDFDSKKDVDNNRLPPKSAEAAQQEIEKGIVDTRNLLVMDMDKCVRCGNCSLACHKVHGQSRLVLRGVQITRPKNLESKKIQHVLTPQVCIQCKTPECLQLAGLNTPRLFFHRDCSR
jgi:ferredoxin